MNTEQINDTGLALIQKLGLSSPVVRYYNKLGELFAHDPYVEVGPLTPGNNGGSYMARLTVGDHEKAKQVKRRLACAVEPVELGKLSFQAVVIDSTEGNAVLQAAKAFFKGNGMVESIETANIPGGYRNYVVCKASPVVQYKADDTTSIDGYQSMLYADLVKEMLVGEPELSICTVSNR